MATLPPKLCPECGEEYVHTVLVCPDCDVPLGSDAPAAPAAFQLPPAEELVALRNAEVPWIDGLAHALADAGIPSRVELPRSEDTKSVQSRGLGAIRCTIFVRPQDAPAAAAVDAAFARTQVPDLPADTVQWSESDACPGCGTALPADAVECPECGLAFGG
jgi:hypothetical protein